MKKTVGIITLPGNFNYGNRLQCYAMVEALRNIGCDSYVLERENSFPFYCRAYYRLKLLISSIANIEPGINPEKMSTPERTMAFSNFSNRIPTIILPGNGYSACDKFDYVVVGSDQVWNPDGISHQEKWYFAKFIEPKKRIAVAASVGIDEFVNAKQAKVLSDGVKGFSRIAVREKRAAELIEQCSGCTAEVICDPTLALPVERWRDVADNRLTPSKPYVFTYLLGGVGVEASDILDKVTDHGRIPVIPLSDRQKPGEPDAGPAEFISLIDHASHVVTDSFHAAVFSSILQTPLTIVHREGGASMFSRLEQLSEMLGIEEKVCGSPSFDLSRADDYEGVPEAIDRERKKFMSYLEGCLDSQLPGWREGARG